MSTDILLALAPYLNCFLPLLVGMLAGIVLSLLASRGKVSPRFRDRLTVFITVGVWLVLTVVLWLVNQDNPITNRINRGGGLS